LAIKAEDLIGDEEECERSTNMTEDKESSLESSGKNIDFLGSLL